MRGASRAGAVTLGMRLGPAKFPNVGKIHPKHPRGVNGPLLPSVLDLGCGVISADQHPRKKTPTLGAELRIYFYWLIARALSRQFGW